MDELQKRGGKLLYDPELIVHRRPRHSLRAFVKMLLNYGRGRAEQVRLHPTPRSAPNFAPPLFCLYLLALPFLVIFIGSISLAPLAVYLAALILQALALIPSGGVIRSICAVPLIFLTHVLYGAGFVRGLFTRLKSPADRPATQVVLERVAL